MWYPLASVAAKLALGIPLPELRYKDWEEMGWGVGVRSWELGEEKHLWDKE